MISGLFQGSVLVSDAGALVFPLNQAARGKAKSLKRDLSLQIFFRKLTTDSLVKSREKFLHGWAELCSRAKGSCNGNRVLFTLMPAVSTAPRCYTGLGAPRASNRGRNHCSPQSFCCKTTAWRLVPLFFCGDRFATIKSASGFLTPQVLRLSGTCSSDDHNGSSWL